MISRKKVAKILQVHLSFFLVVFHHCDWLFSQKYPGLLQLVSNGWTLPNIMAFFGLNITWIIDVKMVSVILNFIKYVLITKSQKLILQ